jgi:hypothetical protein
MNRRPPKDQREPWPNIEPDDRAATASELERGRAVGAERESGGALSGLVDSHTAYVTGTGPAALCVVSGGLPTLGKRHR